MRTTVLTLMLAVLGWAQPKPITVPPSTGGVGSFTALTGDATSTATGGATTIQRLSSLLVHNVAFSATPTFDLSLGSIQTISLTGNVTSSTLSHLHAGGMVVFQICQPSLGGPYTFAWPAAVVGPMTVGNVSGKCSEQWFYSADGTTLRSLNFGVINQ